MDKRSYSFAHWMAFTYLKKRAYVHLAVTVLFFLLLLLLFCSLAMTAATNSSSSSKNNCNDWQARTILKLQQTVECVHFLRAVVLFFTYSLFNSFFFFTFMSDSVFQTSVCTLCYCSCIVIPYIGCNRVRLWDIFCGMVSYRHECSFICARTYLRIYIKYNII